MSCERFAGALTDHAAGADLPPAVRTHLVECVGCREFLAGQERLVSEMDGDLTAMFAVEPSVEFAARVRRRVDVERDRRSTFGIWRWAFGVAAAAVVAVAVVMVIRGRGAAPVPSEAPPPSQAVRVPTPPAPEQTAPPVVGVAPTPPVAGGRVPESRQAIAVQARPAAIPSEPDVLVPPDRRLAIARLLAMSRDGRLDDRVMPPDPPTAPQNLEAPPVLPLVVDGLKLTPIAIDRGQLPGGGSDSKPRPQAAN